MDRNHRLYLIGFFGVYLSIAQLFLPLLNNGDDFFLFSSWRLFATSKSERVVDITWDKGSSFLFRDHKEKAKALGINIHKLWYGLQNNNIERIKEDYLELLKRLADCDHLSLVELDLSLREHIIFKQQTHNFKQVRLCRD